MKTQKLFVVIFTCLFSLTTELHSQASDGNKEWLGWKYKNLVFFESGNSLFALLHG